MQRLGALYPPTSNLIRDAADYAAQVQKCKLLGKVQATPPYALPSDWKKKVRNQAGALGANWVLADTEGLKSTVDGEEYLCP